MVKKNWDADCSCLSSPCQQAVSPFVYGVIEVEVEVEVESIDECIDACLSMQIQEKCCFFFSAQLLISVRGAFVYQSSLIITC